MKKLYYILAAAICLSFSGDPEGSVKWLNIRPEISLNYNRPGFDIAPADYPDILPDLRDSSKNPFNSYEVPLDWWIYNADRDLWFVSVSSYGVVADGSTDDSTNLQTAFDSGNNLEFPSSANIRVTQQIEVDDNAGDQTFTGNDCTVMMTSGQLVGYSTGAVIRADKRNGSGGQYGVVYFDGLNVDPAGHAGQGYNINSSFELTNLSVGDVYLPSGETLDAAGVWVALNQPTPSNSITFTNALIDEVDVADITALASDSSPGSGDGKSKGIQINAFSATVSNDITIRNFTLNGVWGDDADALDLFMYDNHENWTGEAYVQNGVISNAGRRLMKLTFPHVLVENVVFNETDPDDPNIQYEASACCGISVFRTTTQVPANRDITFRNITYNGRETPFFDDFDIVVRSTNDFTLEGSTLNNAKLWFRQGEGGMGDVFIIGNEWGDANSYIDDYDSGGLWQGGAGIYLANNTTNGATLNQLSSSGTTPSAPVSCYNGIQDGTETGVDCGGDCAACGGGPPPGTNNGKAAIGAKARIIFSGEK